MNIDDKMKELVKVQEKIEEVKKITGNRDPYEVWASSVFSLNNKLKKYDEEDLR